MTPTFLKISVSTLALCVMAGSALAGGYGRGSANLDPLFEEGTYTSAGVAVTSPTRSVATANGVATSGVGATDFAETYATFGATVATDIYGGLRCAGSLAQPYGADANYGLSRIAIDANGALNTGPNTTSSSLSSLEYGATCAYRADVGPGKAYLIGGIFGQQLTYSERRGFSAGTIGVAAIDMEDTGFGYRFGVGYAIPEIALKASLVYRSEVDHRMEGTQEFQAPMPLVGKWGIFAEASTPQSVKLSLQSGVAEGWLVFGSVEWTDWSVIQRIDVRCIAANPGACGPGGFSPGGPGIDAYFSDGWNVNLGVGHKFNDMFSGSLSLTWDQGVSDNYLGAKRSSFTDTWTIAAGGAFNPNPNASLRAGLAYSMLTSGAETGLLGGKTLTYDSDYAISGGVSANFKF
jgi:long-chain fatty acid transport protein